VNFQDHRGSLTRSFSTIKIKFLKMDGVNPAYVVLDTSLRFVRLLQLDKCSLTLFGSLRGNFMSLNASTSVTCSVVRRGTSSFWC
jgi:hypothetical protein